MRPVQARFVPVQRASYGARPESVVATDRQPSSDGGLVALAALAAYYRIAVDPAQLAHDLGLGDRRLEGSDLVRAAGRLTLKARLLGNQEPARLSTVPLPCIIRTIAGGYFLVVARLPDGSFRLFDPVARRQIDQALEWIASTWSGEIILVTKRAFGSGITPVAFGFKWFLPSVWRYRRPLGQVLVNSFLIQILALATPLFFQVIIDKVLLHKSASTLLVVTVGLLLLGAFDVVLQYLRTYALSHTTSRIDVELGSRLFSHLLRLPLAYFESRAAGQTVARMRELETIRSFMTGQGLSSILDLLFAVLFIALLFFYSPVLTLIILGAIPCYVAICLLALPVLRAKINDKFNRGAESQQFLVETVVGIQTLKAAAVEPLLRNQWEERLAAYVRTSFGATVVSSAGQAAIQYVSKASTALILFVGAGLVMKGEMSVGALIAYNMIANQVSGPILRLAQLWQDFQQARVSIERMGDILNCQTETRSLASVHLPAVQGRITLSNVTFRYRADGADVLRGISLDIPAGQVIGIVGPSGSGKSTLTKLVQRLYVPDRGQVLIDGIDIGQLDPAWLRRQIGVVLQENVLFNRTIHENIALAQPGMPRSAVIAVARLAGADEFISQLPLGYDTQIEERGANLSGGQRQRIAIARALATNPRILILDEATSALDYESERIVQQNMRRIVEGRTVIIIAHRLAAVRNADRIVTVKDGAIVEEGTHRELIDRKHSLYGRLWKVQLEGAES